MSKRKFIFFKMFDCDHCDTFANNTWEDLTNNPTLRNSVDFYLYKFGRETLPNGEYINHPLKSPFDKIVKYAPYLMLMDDEGRTWECKHLDYDGVTNWIINSSKIQPAPQPSKETKSNNTMYESKTKRVGDKLYICKDDRCSLYEEISI
jgi:hypothetical protein